MSPLRPSLIAGALVGAVVTSTAAGLLRRTPPGGRERWTRHNFTGAEVSLLEGPAVVAGASAAGFGLAPAGFAALAGGALGLIDDLVGSSDDRGLRGHLRALLRGEPTTGALKVLGLGLTGLAASAAIDRRPAGVLLGAGVVAGTANLINLFDLRPGRALKVVLVLSAPLLPGGGYPAGVLVGTAAAALPGDLAGRTMLGDTGANALGAGLGTVAVSRTSPAARAVLFAALVALTLASERVSFSAVIAGRPVLRRFDEWGRSIA